MMDPSLSMRRMGLSRLSKWIFSTCWGAMTSRLISVLMVRESPDRVVVSYSRFGAASRGPE